MAVTANDVYTLALSFLGERPADNDMKNYYAIPWLNMLLHECLPYENSMRAFNGTAKLLTAPTLTALTDTIDYQDSITRVALPYGLASLVFQDDDNEYRAEKYRNLYTSALSECQKTKERDVAQYGGEE